jgi:H+/Cl- antiporter ClcA
MKSILEMKTNKKGQTGMIMSIFIAILILVVVVLPLVAQTIGDLKGDTSANLSTSQKNLLDKSTTLLVVLAVLVPVSAIAYMFMSKR